MDTNVLSNINLNDNNFKDNTKDFLDKNMLTTLKDKINHNLCISIKNKKTYVQCPRLKKEGHDFCGYHCRSKNVTRYDLWLDSKIKELKQDIKVVNEPKNRTIVKSIKNKRKRRVKIKINEATNLEEFMGNYRFFLVKQLHNYINKFKLFDIIGNVRKKKEILTILDKYKDTFYNCYSNLDKVIKIQSWLRKCIVQNRLSCNNECDFFMLEPLFDIPCGAFIRLKDIDGFWYGFEITSLKETLKTSDQNPYNRNKFSEKNIKKIRNFIKSIESKKGIELNIEKDVFSPKQELEHKAVSIFQKFDMLGNYTDHSWFLDLNLGQLKRLYREAEDMWNYRAQIPPSIKPQYVYGGKAFCIPYIVIDHMIEEQKMELQHIILDQFNRFATEGIDEDMRKLGVMLMLSTLVIVSEAAASAMPQYVQNFV